MTKKQKKMRNRILVTLLLFILLFALDKLHVISEWPRLVLFVVYVIPYLIIGYDVIKKAAINIKNGQVFDENFLMMIATFAAFAIGEYDEALAVMLFIRLVNCFRDTLWEKADSPLRR